MSPCLDLSLDGIGEVQNTGFAFSIGTGVTADFLGFNSRSREGATGRVAQAVGNSIVSIHAYLKSGSAAHIFYNAAPANAGKQNTDKKRAAIGKAPANTENRQHAQLFISGRIFRQVRNCLRQSLCLYRRGRTGLPRSIRVCAVRRT